MIRFFLLIFLLLSPLRAADDTARLASAKKALESSDEIEQFRGYNEFKTIYLRAMLDKNTAAAREALDGIIRGGKQLGVDVSKYEGDLARL
ncbi:MAG: N-acetylmuramoyl-L-alanine amidase, partial [Campylobacterales bacterium]|nr:N-acetylmuramoyl-L-alanine amidase [Campylobacterales bacterium]